jgi:bifunctional UDP-N-acetylglucosamine pyrophosphorylase/glucosamine-1-phosphate N-acetyltransferase
MRNVCAIVLAGGRGERMRSVLPKVLNELSGKPLIFWTLQMLEDVGLKSVVVVTGYQAGKVENYIRGAGFKVSFVKQDRLKGTAYATEVGLKKVPDHCSQIIVIYGDDSAFYKSRTIRKFIDYHVAHGNDATFLTARLLKPSSIGGLEINSKGEVLGVLTKGQLEARGVTDHEIACGSFCFRRQWLKDNIKKIKRSKVSGEYPLPGLIYVALAGGRCIKTYSADASEWFGINTRGELERAQRKFAKK